MHRVTLAAAVLAAAVLATAMGSMAAARTSPGNPSPAPDAAPAGAHAFDSLAGRWTAHHRRLKERLAGSQEWEEFAGTMDCRRLMGGSVIARDSRYDAPGGTQRGVGLSSYDAKTDQWATWGLDGRHPAAEIDPPLEGRFDNGAGTFFADDTLRGKPVRLRVTWSRLTPTSARWEQALSPDGGKTWETDWITDFERAPAHESADRPQAMKDGDPAGLHDFDFLIGSWRAHHRLLKDRLAGSHEWTELEGTLVTRQLMNGWANMGDNVFQKPGGDLRGVSLRSFDAKTGQWAVWWLDGRNPGGNLGPPVHGHFENGVGTFLSADTLRGKPVLLRVTWSHITPTAAVWDQALSNDGGKTWETNWITEFRRIS